MNEHVLEDTNLIDISPRVKRKHIYESFDIKTAHVAPRRVFPAVYVFTILTYISRVSIARVY